MPTILLLDVDGVLIHARGYRASIRATLEYIHRRMGQDHLEPPTETDMLTFEAENIIFEWDSAPLCTAALLDQVRDLHGRALDETLENIAHADVTLTRPDYAALARRVPKPLSDDVKPSRAALGTLFPETPLYIELLGNAHTIDAPITRLFQHSVLGDEQYARTYGLTPLFSTESLLEKLDIPMLAPEYRDRMIEEVDIRPTIYTARPSLPPGFVMNWRGYSPEAEIAQRLLGMTAVPLIGYGRMQWLAQQHGVPTNTYVKPSPVQPLAAIYSAILHDMDDPQWEKRALELAVSDDPLPETLFSDPWHVIIFEDSYGSIQGARQAVQRISQYHEVKFTAVGIAADPAKTASLSQVADHVAPDINAGLAWALGW